jgi:hypothetical protein
MRTFLEIPCCCLIPPSTPTPLLYASSIFRHGVEIDLMAEASFETSFDSQQPKLELKLVWALSEAKFYFGCIASILKQFRCFD